MPGSVPFLYGRAVRWTTRTLQPIRLQLAVSAMPTVSIGQRRWSGAEIRRHLSLHRHSAWRPTTKTGAAAKYASTLSGDAPRASTGSPRVSATRVTGQTEESSFNPACGHAVTPNAHGLMQERSWPPLGGCPA